MGYVLFVIEVFLYIYFGFSVIYTLIFTIAGWTGYKSLGIDLKQPKKFNRIAILVPAYQEDEVIISAAEKLRGLKYPKESYTVFVIADSMQPKTIQKLKSLVEVIEVKFEESTKSKSLNYAMNEISEPFDVAIISDGDNILEDDFLSIINHGFNCGYRAMQGQRVAKNTNTKMAILDAASEAINNHVYRRGFNGMGLSSAVIGSGMAFDYQLFKEVMTENKAVGGFDKILQLELIQRRIRIMYLESAIAFDEKVETVQAFQNQRKRWISSQIKYVSKNFLNGWKNLFAKNFDYFNIAILCGIMPPRILLLAVLCFIILITTIFHEFFFLGPIYWSGLLFVYVLTLMMCIPRMLVHKSFLVALVKLPATFLSMLLALIGIKQADDKFIHTKHTNPSINNVFHKKKRT